MTVEAADELEELRARVTAGEVVDGRGVTAPDLARSVAVAGAVGAPLLPALDAAGRAMADRDEVAGSVRVATAQARAVAGGLVALPVLLVPGLAAMLDLDLIGFYTSSAGTVVAAVAVLLVALGATTVRAALRRAVRMSAPPDAGHPADDEVVDLIATACAGGTPPAEACRLAATHAPSRRDALHRLALGLSLGAEPVLPAPFDRVRDTLERSGRLGAPVEPALRRLAASLRDQRRIRALESAQRLPALLAFPTALCLLPASILLVGAPLVASGLEAVAGTN